MVRRKQGITLMELIVAAAVTSIVLGGMFALMNSMQGSQNIFGQQNYLAGATQAMLNRILKDASQAVGDSVETGIYLVDDLATSALIPAGEATFCFHQRQEAVPNDKWICYWQAGTTLNVCDKTFIEGIDKRGADGACIASTRRFVGSLPAGTINNNNPDFIVPDTNPATNDNLFKIELINRVDPINPKSEHNFEYVTVGEVVPAGYSL